MKSASTGVTSQVDLGDKCGTSSTTTGHCTTSNSACVETSQDERRCQCVRSFVRKSSECVQAPTLLTSKKKYVYEIYDNHQTSVGVIEAKVYDWISPSSFQVATYPSDSMFVASIVNGTSTKISIAAGRQAKPGTYNLILKVSARLDHLDVVDVVEVTITVRSRISDPPDVVLFLSDGTLKNAIIDNVKIRTNFQDSTYELTSTASEFGVRSDGSVYCNQDILVDDIAGTNYIAVERNFKVTASKGGTTVDLALYKVLIVKNRYQISLDENLVSIIAQFSLSSDNFKFSSDDLPDKFTLAGNRISSAMLDYENVKSYDFSVVVRTKDNSLRTSVKLNVRVNDFNDESPVFLKQKFHFKTLSNTLSNTVIGVVTARDPDTVGSLYYKMNSNSNHTDFFTVKETTGALVSAKTLTRDHFGLSITITVDVCDEKPSSSSSPRCDEATVIINLIPITLETRNLGYSFNGTVEENQPIGTAVTSVKVTGFTGYRSIDMRSSQLYSLDKDTGDITTLKSLDRELDSEKSNQYFIQAYAEGKDQCFLDDLGSITITVTDENDNRPIPTQSEYSGTIRENSASGLEVHFDPIIRVTDLDSEEYGKATFVLKGSGSNKFSVSTPDGKIAVIKTIGQLDRETQSQYSLVLTAGDGVASDGSRHDINIKVTIDVLDVNDNAPKFAPQSYSLTVTEDEEPSFILTVHADDADCGSGDADCGPNREVKYLIVSGGQGFFSIDENTGSINTTQKIDREKHQTFSLKVVATDNGNPKLTGQTTVSVSVTDINDNDPVITNVKPLTFEENKSCSVPITTIQATDADDGQNAKVEFSTTDTKFQISPSGVLRCVSPLDYEEQQHHNIVIVASDGGVPSRSTHKTIVVSVTDVNDNAPQFSTLKYTANITIAELRENKPVIVLDATDADSGKAGEITFSISHAIFNTTSTNNVGVVRVKPGVNNGQPGTYTMTVTATDNGTPPLSSQATITITVVDSTTNVVHFEKNDFMFDVQEEKEYASQAIGTVEAVYDKNSITVEYNLPEALASSFHINSQTGELFCNKRLDRETKASYQIVVRVYSKADKKDGDVALITITVTDINDNSPQFTVTDSNRLIFEVPENEQGYTVYTITATDKDSGENARITYTISGTESYLPFQVHSTSGVISVTNALDYEIKRQYKLTITAVDHGHGQRAAEVKITVDVVDKNDNPPVFEAAEYSAHVSEASVAGDVVTYVAATDRDTNANLQYVVGKITGDDCSFTVVIDDDATTGKIEAKLQVGDSQLDHERNDYCQVEVIVYDEVNHNIGHSATTTVLISIDDANDNSPVFEGSPYNVSISRDAELDFVVFDESTIKANDKDSGQNGKIKFSLSGDGSKYFEINPSLGKITVKTSLRLAADYIYPILTATDGGEKPRSAITTVKIKITDANPSPWFKKSYTFTVVEEAKPEEFKNKIEASDWINNEAKRCDCVYELSSQQEHEGFFTIDSSAGDLKQIKVIDREQIGDSMFISIKATDKGQPPKSTETKVEIKIQDINDNPPHFSTAEDNQDFSVLQNSLVDSSFGKISYTDEDSAKFSKAAIDIMFVMPPTAKQLFRLENGNIFVNGPLTRNAMDNYDVQLFVRVKSIDPVTTSAAGSLVDIATINLHVIYSTNNTAPTFSKDLYEYKLPFLAKKNTIIDVGIAATDVDGDVVTYHFIGDNPRDIFQLDVKTGKIELQYDVDGTIPTLIWFNVSAVDNNIVPKTSYAAVKIIVTNSEATECLTKSKAQTMRDDASTKSVFTILFGIMVAALSVVAILLVFTCYKWRVAKKTKLQYSESSPPIGYEHPTQEMKQSETSHYDRPQGAGYSSLDKTDFSAPGGMRNPAYSSSGEIGPLRPQHFDEPPADYHHYDQALEPNQIELEELSNRSRQQPPNV